MIQKQNISAITPRRVVITGIGAVSPNGIGKENFWNATKNGVSGVHRISRFKTDDLLCKIAGTIEDFEPEKYLPASSLKSCSRTIPVAIAAVEECLKDRGILNDKTKKVEEGFRQDLGIVIGSGGSGFDFSESQFALYFSGKRRQVSPYAISSSLVGMLSSEISIKFELNGRSHVIANGCTSSTDAIGYAYQTIRFGEADCLLSGGAESCISHGMMSGFERMKANPVHFNDAPERGSRPFNKDREGFVLAEGSWMLFLEEYEHAKARNAHIYGEIIGYGTTCDAYHRVKLMPSGEQSARAMRSALKGSGLTPDDIDYINYHGTSTQLNDATETKAVKLLFGKETTVPGSSTKSLIGHPQGASGAMGVVTTLLAMRDSFAPPTINIENPDPECDLDYIPNKGRELTIQHALCNCISFGAKNSVLLLRRHLL